MTDDDGMSDLVCPKCHGPMRTFERNGIHVDQCTECRGIFLDRGELEHLISAEAQWTAASAAPAAPPAPSYQQERGYESSGKSSYYKRKKKSFLEELFD